MAGDWIKMRLDLQTHPKVVRILSATKADKFRAIGGLHAVWAVFDTHSADGSLPGYTPDTLDHIIGWPGFSEAMIKVGWLEFDGDETMYLPEFSEHNGTSGKRRAEDQKRKRDGRKAPNPVRNLSEVAADKLRKKSGLEKRREEKKETTTKTKAKAPAAPSFVPTIELQSLQVSEQTIADWLALRAKKRAPVTATVLGRLQREAETAGMSLDATLALCCVRGWTGFEAAWVQKDVHPVLPGAPAKFNPTAHVNRNRSSTS
ncbi:MAG: hypothetical protein V4508_02360 [Pseudomonadota bacterium]